MRRLELDATKRRLAKAQTVWDLRTIAAKRVPRAVFDYVDGGAGAEVSLRRLYDAFARVEFSPRLPRPVGEVDTATTVCGIRSALPVMLAPTGFTRMMHHEGELAVARAAAAAQVPFALSTMGTCSIEEVAAAAPTAAPVMQVYVWRERAVTERLIERARQSGCAVLVLTIDTPIAATRLRDVRNGMTIPPSLTPGTVANGLRHGRWWFNLLTTPPLEFASLQSWSGTVAELATSLFDPSVEGRDLRWVRDLWPGKLLVKGVLTARGCLDAFEAGADGVVLSNHGGRQLDRAATPLEVLPEVVAAVGEDGEVLIDGGVMSGGDVVAAVALGASAVLIGRAYLYGLMAGGRRGVEWMLDCIERETRETMQLLGASSVAELTPDLVRIQPRQMPK